MDTIATEMDAGPPPGPEDPHLDPYRPVEVRCAPNYAGEEKMEPVPVIWLPIARQLVAAGRDRAFHSSARGKEGNRLLHAAWGAIRRIWFEEAAPAGMSQVAAAKLVGVSRAQLHTILTADESGPVRRAG